MKIQMIEDLLDAVTNPTEKESTTIVENTSKECVESQMVTTMREKIEELEREKESIEFYEENRDILMTSASEFFRQVGIVPNVIPVSFIFCLHNIPNTRRLYVFDFLDISETNGKFPETMDQGHYRYFLSVVNEALNKASLEVNMKMNREQRENFDAEVRKREQEGYSPEYLDYANWFRIIIRKFYVAMPDAVQSYLLIKNREALTTITKSVMDKCNNLRLSDNIIRQYIDEALAENGLSYKELKEFSWPEFAESRKNQQREAKRKAKELKGC